MAFYWRSTSDFAEGSLGELSSLCEKAEELLLEPNPVNAFRLLQDFHNQWREIGPVPQESKNEIWERFKEATSQINKRHHEYFEKQKDDQKKNLEAKIAIIEKLEKFEPGTDVQAAFEHLKELQRKWSEIGFVPFNLKDEITNKYRAAINKEFDKLKIGDDDKSILKYKTKLDNLKANPKASRKVRNERDKFFTKIKQLESDIVLWENNIGFFAKSTNADTMIREVEDKIENAKKMMKTLEEKVRMIDQSGLDD